MHPNDGRVVSNFIVQALQNENITIYGDGSQIRSFCYVDDLINGLILLMNSDIESPVNMGNPKEFTIIELAEKIMDLTSSEAGYVLNDLPEDDPQRRCPDINFAIQNLGWKPKIELSEGLVPTLEWFKECLFE